jgi:hypothetical protein
MAWSVCQCCPRQGPRQPPTPVALVFLNSPKPSLAASVLTASNFQVPSPRQIPLLHLKRRMGAQQEYSSNLMGVCLGVCTAGDSHTRHDMQGQEFAFTGAGKCSIGVGIQKSLVMWCSCRRLLLLIQPRRRRIPPGIFQRFGSRGPALIVVSFNQILGLQAGPGGIF